MSKFKKPRVDDELENFAEPMRESPLIFPTSKPSPRNPAAHSTATGPDDEENMYGNDVDGPNLGADLSNDMLNPDPTTDEMDDDSREIARDDFIKKNR